MMGVLIIFALICGAAFASIYAVLEGGAVLSQFEQATGNSSESAIEDALSLTELDAYVGYFKWPALGLAIFMVLTVLVLLYLCLVKQNSAPKLKPRKDAKKSPADQANQSV
jgi:hypothetical protein